MFTNMRWTGTVVLITGVAVIVKNTTVFVVPAEKYNAEEVHVWHGL